MDNHHPDAAASIFKAALAGICANPNFFGPTMQQSPDAAVEFARACVRAAYNNDPARMYPDWTGPHSPDDLRRSGIHWINTN